jgi:aryl carrier-like protein
VNPIIRYSLLLAVAGACLGMYLSATGSSGEKPGLKTASRDPVSTQSPRGGELISPFAAGTADQGNGLATLPLPSAPVYARNGRQVDLDGLTAQQYISKWNSLARAGDKDAAYNVYQATAVCASNDEPAPAYRSTAELEQFHAEREKMLALCEGVNPAQLQERLSFLAVAARAGKVEAQIDYFMEGPYGRDTDLAKSAEDPVVQQWKTEAVTELKSAAGQGEPFALALLSQVYDAGELLPRDARLSLAYKVAEADARNRVLSEEQLRRNAGAQMSDADFASALQTGRQIASACCKKNRLSPQE